MKFIIELEKNSNEEDWGASMEIDEQVYDGVGATPELAFKYLVAFPEIQTEFAKKIE